MDTRAEIEKLTTTFAKAVTDKDFAALGTLYEERGRFLPPGGPMVEGPAAIQAAIQKIVERGVQALDLKVVDVVEAGDFVIPRYNVSDPLAYGEAEIDKIRGKSIVVWRRQKDGTLKIWADTFNGD